MKPHLESSLHRIKGLARLSVADSNAQRIMSDIYDEAERAMQREKYEEFEERKKLASTQNAGSKDHES